MSTRYYHEDSKSLDTLWELREIDAWADGEGGWTWNDSFVPKRFRSDADDLRGLFLRVLADVRGRHVKSGMTSLCSETGLTPTGTKTILRLTA